MNAADARRPFSPPALLASAIRASAASLRAKLERLRQLVDTLARPLAPFVTTKPGALGLGLYTAERLARASGGSLQRENAPGGGAVVTLFLQLAPPEEPCAAGAGAPASQA